MRRIDLGISKMFDKKIRITAIGGFVALGLTLSDASVAAFTEADAAELKAEAITTPSSSVRRV